MSDDSQPKDVDSYIANSDEQARPIMEELRKIIKSTIPDVEESISWRVPFYRYHGALIGFAVYKNHVSLGFATQLENEDRKMLEEKGFKTGNKTVQIKFGQKVPADEINQILKSKAKLNESPKATK
jgi:uncharacterized protein